MSSNYNLNSAEPVLIALKSTGLTASRFAFLSVFIAGALLPLAFSPVDFYFIAVISPAVFFYFLLFASPRRAAWLGWWFGMGFFGVGVSWVFVAIYVFGFSSISTAVLLTFLSINVLAAVIALQGYLGVYFIQKIKLSNQGIIILLVFPLTWVLFEWFRGWFLTGFPWLSLGYSQTGSVLSGYAAVIGVYGISLMAVLTSGLFLYVL
ncbi:MAG: apolipoprotein N-acyltransferase, partial [Gammaproteobacteria bacterium]|nr:apolipoprotein N-acyltransferase [Gammaproteobacteria bacterium]